MNGVETNVTEKTKRNKNTNFADRFSNRVTENFKWLGILVRNEKIFIINYKNAIKGKNLF